MDYGCLLPKNTRTVVSIWIKFGMEIDYSLKQHNYNLFPDITVIYNLHAVAILNHKVWAFFFKIYE